MLTWLTWLTCVHSKDNHIQGNLSECHMLTHTRECMWCGITCCSTVDSNGQAFLFAMLNGNMDDNDDTMP